MDAKNYKAKVAYLEHDCIQVRVEWKDGEGVCTSNTESEVAGTLQQLKELRDALDNVIAEYYGK